jgi:hypothetical protein
MFLFVEIVYLIWICAIRLPSCLDFHLDYHEGIDVEFPGTIVSEPYILQTDIYEWWIQEIMTCRKQESTFGLIPRPI